MNDMRYEFERKYFGRQQAKYGFNIHLCLENDKFLCIQNYDNKRQVGYMVFIDEIKDNMIMQKIRLSIVHLHN